MREAGLETIIDTDEEVLRLAEISMPRFTAKGSETDVETEVGSRAEFEDRFVLILMLAR